VLSISFSEIRKPGNAIFSQMTRMLGLSGSPADEIANICISSNADALFINSGESIEKWSISSDYEFKVCLNSTDVSLHVYISGSFKINFL
jgi:hypothetical protein